MDELRVEVFRVLNRYGIASRPLEVRADIGDSGLHKFLSGERDLKLSRFERIVKVLAAGTTREREAASALAEVFGRLAGAEMVVHGKGQADGSLVDDVGRLLSFVGQVVRFNEGGSDRQALAEAWRTARDNMDAEMAAMMAPRATRRAA